MVNLGRARTHTKSKCPDCGKPIRLITSINGSTMAVDIEAIPLWFLIEGGVRYEIKSGWKTHNYTCLSKPGYKKNRKRHRK